ncbi:SDR family NAD(P)-dependent oxidoreductase [Salinibacterium sp. ZJ450]|uniref:SDR family NAD(P)-dependent oxidoreductase n=1 Tax=Salinibacterium sp. ZJ450 TaxID=2708338 RepID=UPI00141E9E3D|nr:SDR family NAD(P)-dependent oxidoreductase [Salinibacterium sp. ZJ450]
MRDPEIRFDGKAIVVTGAGRGMGRDHALLLAARGASVIVADNGSAMDGSDASAGPAETVVAEITSSGGVAVSCTADLSTEEGSAAAVQASLDSFGRIDGLLHNASTSPNLYSPDQVPTDQLDLVQRVNVHAGFWMTRAAWPHMKEQGFGRIVYIASHSIYGVRGAAPYASAKSAYIGLARGYALEGAEHDILCNVVLPSAYTRMTERMPTSDYRTWVSNTLAPARVSPGVAYLLSAESHQNGEMFSIGGGRVARVQLAETEGVTGLGDSIEEWRDAFDVVMAQDKRIFPKDQQERFGIVAKALGFTGEIPADAYAVKDVS